MVERPVMDHAFSCLGSPRFGNHAEVMVAHLRRMGKTRQEPGGRPEVAPVSRRVDVEFGQNVTLITVQNSHTWYLFRPRAL